MGRRGIMDRASASYPHGVKGHGIHLYNITGMAETKPITSNSQKYLNTINILSLTGSCNNYCILQLDQQGSGYLNRVQTQ